MKRDLDSFASECFDVLVIGGGIYGACIAREASLQGLSVALIEKNDFCSATSHNSLKIIHSGIRYFQHLDFRRVRESIIERRTWLSIAPHLVKPLKFIIPTQGYLTRGPAALQAAILLHRLFGLDWNHGVPASSRISTGRVYGRAALQKFIPELPMQGLSGAASWHDGHVVDADRVVLECLQAAVAKGATVANYVSADSLTRSGRTVHGVLATDRIGGREMEIKARVTVNAGGPWVAKILSQSIGPDAAAAAPPLAKNMNIVTRKLIGDYGVGIPSKRRSDAVVGTESRLFFVTPWKGVSIIGTTHFPYHGDPDEYRVTEREIEEFVDEINDSYPPARLSPADVYYVYSGLTPAEPETAAGDVERSKHAEIIDHAYRHDLDGLLSVIGVKYTTGRLVAEKAVSLVLGKLGRTGDSKKSRESRLPGAENWSPPAKLPQAGAKSDPRVADLLQRYGSQVPNGAANSRSLAEAFDVCVRHSVESEMALRLDDVLIRRHDLAARGMLTEDCVRRSAKVMSDALDWSASETETQVEQVLRSTRYLCGTEFSSKNKNQNTFN